MRSRLVLLVAIAALIVGALGVIDLFKSEPQPKVAAETIVEKNEEHVAVWMTTKAYEKGRAIDA